MKHRYLILFFALVAVIAVIWGYTQYMLRHEWETNAKNQYQRAFEELVAHAVNMENQLDKALAINSGEQTVQLLNDVWRESNACRENLGQLPLTSLELSGVKTFLVQVGNFAFRTAQSKLGENKRLNDDEREVLQEMHSNSQVVTGELRRMQEDFSEKGGDWLGINSSHQFSSSATTMVDNRNEVSKAFLMLEDGLKRVPDLEFEGNNPDFVPRPQGLSGEYLETKELTEKVKKLFAKNYRDIRVRYERKVSDEFDSQMFLVKAKFGKSGMNREFRCCLSEKGGHLIWLLGSAWKQERAKVDYSAAIRLAEGYAEQFGYNNMKNVAIEYSEGIFTSTLVAERDKILYYPELIKIQITEDYGELCGFDAGVYLTFHQKTYRAPKAKITPNEVKKLCNANLKITAIQLAEVLDEMFNRVLCYQVKGVITGKIYLIYYNANSGKEEKILRIDEFGTEIE